MPEEYCQICGMDVNKETAIKRFGKYFCSAEHAQKYIVAQESRTEKEDSGSNGRGCC